MLVRNLIALLAGIPAWIVSLLLSALFTENFLEALAVAFIFAILTVWLVRRWLMRGRWPRQVAVLAVLGLLTYGGVSALFNALDEMQRPRPATAQTITTRVPTRTPTPRADTPTVTATFTPTAADAPPTLESRTQEIALASAQEEEAAVAPTSTRMPTATAPAIPTSTPLPPTATPQTVALAAEADAPITAVIWNIELNGADPAVIAAQIEAMDDVDLWGLAEVNRPQTRTQFEAAAEAGEDADFGHVLSVSGNGDRLLALYDADRFALVDSWEIDPINTTGNARAPLVLHLQERAGGLEFLFMVNHLYRTRDDERHRQAQLLNEWAREQTLPIIAAGDYNFDWDVNNGDVNHDRGYDLMTADGVWEWERPEELETTQCSETDYGGCRYYSVLDFVFTAGEAREWLSESEILVRDGDFPDNPLTSDHRPVRTVFWPGQVEPPPTATVAVLPTFTPTPLPTFTPTPLPTFTPTPTEALVPPDDRGLTLATAAQGANLRGGPGANYDRVGGVQTGDLLEVVGRNEAGDWVQLADGAWIAAWLVADAPEGLPVVPTPPSIAPEATATPTDTPLPPDEPLSANVIIEYIFYDGDVPQVESDEYVVILNRGDAPANLNGWRINADDPGQDFPFGDVTLEPGDRTRVYTNEIHPEWGGHSFGSGGAIWRNKGECGHLFDASGIEVSTYCFPR